MLYTFATHPLVLEAPVSVLKSQSLFKRNIRVD